MLRKRIIFTLLYCDGFFCLSRNFKLQKIGNYEWLLKNYNFSKISQYIDELIILDVSRKKNNREAFLKTAKSLSANCFMPIAIGGGVKDLDYVDKLMASGADKIILNTSIFDNQILVKKIAKKIGNQSIIASIDLIAEKKNKYNVYVKNGSEKIKLETSQIINKIIKGPFGEIYLNSIDRDGTGQGYDFDMLNYFKKDNKIPLILAGGAGNFKHLLEGLRKKKVDAVATANLLNFVGDGLKDARVKIENLGENISKRDDYL